MFPAKIQYLISNYQVFGVLPLDKILHFFIGAILTVGLRLMGVKPSWTLFFVTMIAVVKEVIDSYTINNSNLEHFVDILVSILYPLLLLGVARLKQHSSAK